MWCVACCLLTAVGCVWRVDCWLLCVVCCLLCVVDAVVLLVVVGVVVVGVADSSVLPWLLLAVVALCAW